MLDLALDEVIFRHPSGFGLGPVSLALPRSTHTVVAGRAGCGASTLLRLIAGELRPQSGTIRIGTRDVSALPARRRPLLFVRSFVDAPDRWSVRHLLVAAARRRTLDREDRFREIDLAASKWTLTSILDRRLGTLSSSERTLANLARIELLKPAILVADRLFEQLNPAEAAAVADDFFRTMRVIGSTVVSAPSTREEIGWSDLVVVLDSGRVVQQGSAAKIYQSPATLSSAAVITDVNTLPIDVRGGRVDSPIGSWEVAGAPFQGPGTAVVPVNAFTRVAQGEESDLIVAVEEAQFHQGRWRVRAYVTGGVPLLIELPFAHDLHKGRLLALRCDFGQIDLFPSNEAHPLPAGAIPPMSETR